MSTKENKALFPNTYAIFFSGNLDAEDIVLAPDIVNGNNTFGAPNQVPPSGLTYSQCT